MLLMISAFVSIALLLGIEKKEKTDENGEISGKGVNKKDIRVHNYLCGGHRLFNMILSHEGLKI
jgi:hypothetical protein